MDNQFENGNQIIFQKTPKEQRQHTNNNINKNKINQTITTTTSMLQGNDKFFPCWCVLAMHQE